MGGDPPNHPIILLALHDNLLLLGIVMQIFAMQDVWYAIPVKERAIEPEECHNSQVESQCDRLLLMFYQIKLSVKHRD